MGVIERARVMLMEDVMRSGSIMDERGVLAVAMEQAMRDVRVYMASLEDELHYIEAASHPARSEG